jgi:hypothetical protein
MRWRSQLIGFGDQLLSECRRNSASSMHSTTNLEQPAVIVREIVCRIVGCRSVFARFWEWPHAKVCSQERWLGGHHGSHQ